jgi:hypothetical protein
MGNYFNIKRTKESVMWGRITSPIRLDEVRQFVEASADYEWGSQSKDTPVRNSDGSISILPRLHGFRRAGKETSPLNLCYEFNGGITVHEDGTESTLHFCEALAAALGAKLFKT